MTDIAPFPVRSPWDEASRNSVVDAATLHAPPHAPGDPLWREHGWGLSGRTVAALVGAILAASCAVWMLG